MPHEATERSPARPGGRRVLYLLLVIALIPRVAAAVLLGGDTLRFADEGIYLDAARDLAAGIGLTGPAASVPGYAALLAGLGAVVPGDVLPFRVAQAVLLALGAVLCVVMGRRLGTPAAGLLAGLVYALDPLLAVSASLLYPDPPAALLLAGSLLLIWRDKRPGSLLRLFAGGSLLGAFVLFRLVGLVLVPPTVLYLLAGGATPGRRRTVEVAVLLAGWLLVVGPWVGQNHRETGRWLPIATAVQSAPGIGPSVEEQGVTRAVVAAATNDPAGFARRALVEFAHFWEPYPTRLLTDHASVRAALSERDPRLSTAPIARRSLRDTISAVSFSAEVILAVIGVWIGWRTRRRETLWLVGLMLSFALGYALFYGKIRYRIPVLPILFAFAGAGGVRLVTLIAARGRDAVTRRVGLAAPP